MQRYAALIRNSNAKLIREKSGLVFAEIYSFTLKISEFNPLKKSCYQVLFKFYANKNAMVNIWNNDERFFGYSILGALYLYDCNDYLYRFSRYSDANLPEHGLNAIEYLVNLIFWGLRSDITFRSTCRVVRRWREGALFYLVQWDCERLY